MSNCGGIYLKDGKCENCGLVIVEKAEKRQETGNQSQDQKQMKLMVCPDCGKMISKDAYICPQCGCPFPGNMKGIGSEKTNVRKQAGMRILGTIVAIIIAVLIIWYIAAPYSTPVWLQKIGGTIKSFFTGETSYKIFNPSKIGQ